MEPEPLAPGLLRFALPTETLPPSDHTSAFLVGWRPALLVEPAPSAPAVQRAWIGWLREAARRGLRLLAILPTHHHGDHVGAAEALREALGAPLWAHRATAERLAVSTDRLLQGGERLALRERTGAPLSAELVHTPGHAPGHLAVHLPERRWVLAGDMVSTESTILVDPEDGGDMAAYVCSLGRLRALGADWIAPAHGPPAPATEVLEHFLAHRAARRRRVLEALGAEPRAERELLEEAYADTPSAPRPLALRSLRAHLLQLRQEGLAERVGSRWRLAAGPPGR